MAKEGRMGGMRRRGECWKMAECRREHAPSPHPPPSPLAGEGQGEGGWSGLFSRCHSGLFILVIPDVSTAVILACSLLSFLTFLTLSFPTLLIGNPKAGLKGPRGSRRSPTLLRSLHHGAERKPWIPAN